MSLLKLETDFRRTRASCIWEGGEDGESGEDDEDEEDGEGGGVK